MFSKSNVRLRSSWRVGIIPPHKYIKYKYGKENIVSGEIEDLGAYTLANELDVVTGAESRANNKGKILWAEKKR